jgi:hypothetical protein
LNSVLRKISSRCWHSDPKGQKSFGDVLSDLEEISRRNSRIYRSSK